MAPRASSRRVQAAARSMPIRLGVAYGIIARAFGPSRPSIKNREHSHNLFPHFVRLAVFSHRGPLFVSLARRGWGLGFRLPKAKNQGEIFAAAARLDKSRHQLFRQSRVHPSPRRSFWFPCPRRLRNPPMEVVAAAAAAAKQKTKKHEKHIHLFYCSECEELALKVAASSDAIELQSINWRYATLPPSCPLSLLASPISWSNLIRRVL